MTAKVVDDIRFRSKERIRMMSNVLGTCGGSKSKHVEELSLIDRSSS